MSHNIVRTLLIEMRWLLKNLDVVSQVDGRRADALSQSTDLAPARAGHHAQSSLIECAVHTVNDFACPTNLHLAFNAFR
jgi:hypothetical protein